MTFKQIRDSVVWVMSMFSKHVEHPNYLMFTGLDAYGFYLVAGNANRADMLALTRAMTNVNG